MCWTGTMILVGLIEWTWLTHLLVLIYLYMAPKCHHWLLARSLWNLRSGGTWILRQSHISTLAEWWMKMVDVPNFSRSQIACRWLRTLQYHDKAVRCAASFSSKCFCQRSRANSDCTKGRGWCLQQYVFCWLIEVVSAMGFRHQSAQLWRTEVFDRLNHWGFIQGSSLCWLLVRMMPQ